MQSLHPTDQTLSSFGLGKLDDASAEAVNEHLEQCPRLPETGRRDVGRQLPRRVRGAQERPRVDSVGRLPGRRTSMPTGGPSSSTPPPPDTLPPGLADHPDYEIIRELGRGGMGVVYLAQNKLMGRDEVLKVVGGHLIERPGVLDRFLREIQSAAKLHHPNIVTAYSAIRLGESIVLRDGVRRGPRPGQAGQGQGPAAGGPRLQLHPPGGPGLQHAHERGMVHRDIKPANLMLSREGKKAIVKVLDFGLAKVTSEGQADSGLTREGQMLGTPDYIAPEQIRDAQTADIRADIYSLGCTFYYLLTGGPPFHGDSLWDIYQAHFSMDAGPLNLVRPEVPVELAALVAKMMAKEPARRFQTPGEVAQALMPFFKPGANPGSRPSPEISRVGQAASSPQPVGGGSAPAQPADRRHGPSRRAAGPVEAEPGEGGVGEPDRIPGERTPRWTRHQKPGQPDGPRGRSGRSPWQAPCSD